MQHWLVANGYDHIVALAKAYRTASARIAALEAELTDARAEARILHPTTMREAQQLQGYVNSIVAPIVLGDPARLATARAALAAVHRLHDAALDATNRILWPLLPRGDATHTAAALDAISARRELDACTNERLHNA